MIDYSGWERKEFNVVGLKLDTLNPRVPVSDRGQIDQLSLLKLFVEEYAVYDLAENISRNGYFPDEVIMVYREDEMTRCVLEGNRRIAALKLLLNPDNAPDKYRSKFRKISASTNKQLIQKVQTVVAPSRDEATPIIIEKHTHTTVKPWSVLMEATYIANIIENSQVKSVTFDQSGFSENDFDRFVRMDKMYRLACSLSLPEDVAAFVRNKEKFPMTIVERLYNNPMVRKVLCVSDDFEEIYDRDTFERRYSVILTDIFTKQASSRSLDTKEDREKYAKKLVEEAPAGNEARSVRIKEVFKETKEPSAGSVSTEKPTRLRSIRKQRGIVPTHFPYRLRAGASIRILCDELKKLSLEDYPNVTATAFRAFLEKSIKVFLKTKGVKRIPFQPKPSRVEGEIEVGQATLGPLMEYLSKKECPYVEKNVKTVISTFRSTNNFSSLSKLNSIMHNEELCLSPDEVRNLWPSLERLFTIMLSEPGETDGQVQNTTKISGRKGGSA